MATAKPISPCTVARTKPSTAIPPSTTRLEHRAPQSGPYLGAFGENFTTEGLLETAVSVGDRYRLGSAVVRVTTPRLPCFKLAAKFQREDMIDRLVRSGRSGFYLSVIEEGEVGAGDEFELLDLRSLPSPSVKSTN